MQSFGINCFKYRSYFTRDILNQNPCSINSFCPNFPDQIYQNSQKIRFFHHTHKANPFLFQITVSHTQFPILIAPFRFNPYCYSTKAPSRSYRRRVSNRLLKSQKPILDQAQFQLAISQILPRFTPEELCNVLTLQNDPLVCLELFHWASQKPRFRHDVLTYHVTIKKLGAAKMYQEMDDIVNQVLAVPSVGSEAMFNTIIYYFTEARKLSRAVSIFKHMKSCTKLNCRPSIRTYHIIFSALLSRGYVLSLHVNDAMRIFHQMSGVYDCQPNSFTYDYLIHGLCAQDRTNNAKELCLEMKTKGFIPSGKSYNSLVSALALGGEVEEAVNYLWEMTEKQRSVDFITYRTVLDEICRRGRVQEAMRLLQELREKGLVEGHDYRKLHYVLEEDYGNSLSRIAAGTGLFYHSIIVFNFFLFSANQE
ncbi:PREDICTED: pentatricopeptide repeat-containing protein At2g27800, mitochondrial-like isoform X2 [Lupinus angustifolius]|uniref:pentatricopeptide repeat-containing protein At2g27800, mitochondrial-like isoform X2 n=1 Tax=Lupinus angustifolius TaxID=3871 RepID=UPI00092E5606|nr:PREDICTED: pentatricopeptide repeat-containing protein At2g27800, mitochondrial-like isoform X2 [Lupinus angustifolius]